MYSNPDKVFRPKTNGYADPLHSTSFGQKRQDGLLDKSVGYSSFLGNGASQPNFVASSPLTKNMLTDPDELYREDTHLSKQMAFYFCVSRILSSIWDRLMIIKDLKVKRTSLFASEKIELWDSSLKSEDIECIIECLKSVLSFIERNVSTRPVMYGRDL